MRRLTVLPASLHYVKFTDQDSLGKYLTQQYHIRTPQELSSCETCHHEPDSGRCQIR